MSADVSKRTPDTLIVGHLGEPGMVPVQLYPSSNPDRVIAAVYPWIGADGNPDPTHDANAAYLALAWNNYDRVAAERNALAEALRGANGVLRDLAKQITSRTHRYEEQSDKTAWDDMDRVMFDGTMASVFEQIGAALASLRKEGA